MLCPLSLDLCLALSVHGEGVQWTYIVIMAIVIA